MLLSDFDDDVQKDIVTFLGLDLSKVEAGSVTVRKWASGYVLVSAKYVDVRPVEWAQPFLDRLTSRETPIVEPQGEAK